MECTCLRHTELPHTTRLFADFIYHPDRLRPFYFHSSQDPAALRRAAAEIDFPPERRAALVSALRAQNGDSPELDLLAKPGTVAVVTGQQVGLFAGPAYTVYKALTAIKLARQLNTQGIPAVPVFWLATEDHDFAEVNHCWVFTPRHDPVKLEIGGPEMTSRTVGGIAISSPPVSALRDCLREFPFGPEVVSSVEQCYAPGRTLGAAFGALLRRILAPYGLLQIDPMSPAIREMAAPVLRRVLEAAPELTAQVMQRNKDLAAAGYHAQVHVESQTSFVFLLENGRRLALRRHDREYNANGRHFPTSELIDRAHQLSPNALLRPVVQDFLLPTTAYIGGPAELAYLAQSEVIYRTVLGRMPVARNRAGFTLLDARSRKLMDRYELALPDFFHGEAALRERIAASLVPAPLARILEETGQSVRASVENLAAEVAGFDPTLAAATRKSRLKIEHQISKVRQKIGREMLARDARASDHARYLYNLIYPERHLQERLYSILPFLARNGPDFATHLYESVNIDCPDHRLLVA